MEQEDEEKQFHRCSFYVERKKRTCRYIIKVGKTLCPEHELATNASDNKDLRIPCPLDPKHTCYKSKLHKHLKVCNARPRETPPYIMKGCNSGGVVSVEHESRKPLKDLPIERVKAAIDKVEKIYLEQIKSNIESYLNSEIHGAVQANYFEADRGEGGRRHLEQASSLIYIMEKFHLLGEDTCVVEMGAGKGGLAYYVSRAINSVLNTAVLLVERAAHRHKKDNKLDSSDTHQVERIRADINDLLLDEVEVIRGCANVVGVSKHLCGVATDFALRCLTNARVLPKTKGILMATCCHHQCVYDSYVAHEFLQENNITKEDFNTMCGLVSWATCGNGLSREKRKKVLPSEVESKRIRSECNEESSDTTRNSPIDEKDNKIDNDVTKSLNLSEEVTKKIGINAKADLDFGHKNKSLNLSQEVREEIGRKAKAVLDFGRLEFLKSHGFNTKLCYYVSTKISPENVCILAYK